MPVITEKKLRDSYKVDKLNSFVIAKNDIITPAAKEFLASKKLEIVNGKILNKKQKTKESNSNLFEEKSNNNETTEVTFQEEKEEKESKTKKVYTDYITGAVYEKKPEYMTQIFGNHLVVKNHKRIILRGKFDILQAETVRYWKKYQKNNKLEADFAETYRYVRDLFISEMVDSEFTDRNILGYDIDTLKDITHNTHKYYNTGHLFEINASYDEKVIDINCLRALSRECELSAVEAFYNNGKVERSDMLKALNRLSSIFYLMMLKANNGDYN